MATYLQADRHLAVATPLGPDALLLRRMAFREVISRPFRLSLDLVAERSAAIPFEKLLGQFITARLGLPGSSARYFNGICTRFSERDRDASFTYYRMRVEPTLVLLGMRRQSRIFQQISVPEILQKMFQGLEVTYQLRGKYYPRDYCVQYGETDFAFTSRLMEEEGIYYYFDHRDGGHQMVVSDAPLAHPALGDPAPVEYEVSEVGERRDDKVTAWQKTQRIRPGRYTLRDHCFELPHDPLTANEAIPPSVRAGEVEHRLRIGQFDRLEVYEYPGAYAQRFDGVDPGGGDRSKDLRKIFEDNARTVGIRMQQGSVSGLVTRGGGHCRRLASGHQFTLTNHHNANGPYLVLSVRHEASLAGDYRSDGGGETAYKNQFTCIPAEAPFRPRRVTPKPIIQGTQTAVVVGPAGEEIFTDKYGRVKVQFHWDREGRRDEGSSCWIRVNTPWADGSFGAVSIPRIGQEVVVAFEEGDPDRPVILGGVYNARNMPPFALPGNKMISGIRSNSYPGGGGNNEISMNDTKGKERMYLHAQYNQDTVVGNNRTAQVGVDSHEQVGNDVTESVGNNKQVSVAVNESTQIGSNQSLQVGANQSVTVGANQTTTVGANKSESVGANKSVNVGSSKTEMVAIASAETIGAAKALSVGAGYAVTVGGAMNTAVGLSSTEQVGIFKSVIVGSKLELQCGASRIIMESGGKITIEGTSILISGSGGIKLSGSTIDLN